jgi:hypothetical protein
VLDWMKKIVPSIQKGQRIWDKCKKIIINLLQILGNETVVSSRSEYYTKKMEDLESFKIDPLCFFLEHDSWVIKRVTTFHKKNVTSEVTEGKFNESRHEKKNIYWGKQTPVLKTVQVKMIWYHTWKKNFT